MRSRPKTRGGLTHPPRSHPQRSARLQTTHAWAKLFPGRVGSGVAQSGLGRRARDPEIAGSNPAARPALPLANPTCPGEEVPSAVGALPLDPGG